MVPNKRVIDLVDEVIEPSIMLTASLMTSHDMQLERNLSEAPFVDGDPELLRICLTNLLNNAAKYGREGGRVVVEVGRDDGDALVSVWNEGEGFSTAEGERLFTKFSRLANPNTKAKKGSGLGLFLTAQIIEQHGGRVIAESEPGEWARFGFTLPLADNLGTTRGQA